MFFSSFRRSLVHAAQLISGCWSAKNIYIMQYSKNYRFRKVQSKWQLCSFKLRSSSIFCRQRFCLLTARLFFTHKTSTIFEWKVVNCDIFQYKIRTFIVQRGTKHVHLIAHTFIKMYVFCAMNVKNTTFFIRVKLIEIIF